MAAVDPQALAWGTVREVKRQEFVNRETGVVEQRGRRVTLLTTAGFLTMSVPITFDKIPFEDFAGQSIAAIIVLRDWSFNNQKGTAYIFERFVTMADLEAIAAVVPTAEVPAK